ncbi:MAG: signal recognition particle receptor subunit alpha [Candidatus Hydrothermarchaeaceae archaeon]
MLEKLGDSLSKAIRRLASAALVDEALVKETVKDIQRALLGADVNVKRVLELSKRIEERAFEEKPKAGLTKKEHVITIVYEELTALLGKGTYTDAKPGRIMLVGLQGSGKTTTIVKLAKYYSKIGLKPFIIAADTHRPAAYEQVLQLVQPLGIDIYGEKQAADAMKVLRDGLKEAKGEAIFLDTAGRHKSQDELFKEMRALDEVFQPDEKFLIIDAGIGQQAGAQAKAFHEAIGVTGVILTKLDGSAKGGGAISAVAETAAPVVFIGTGEKIDALEPFDADRFISRLLGMGDLQSLLEKAKEAMDEERAKEILKGDFTLYDLREQIEAITKMGPLSSVLKMIPGMPSLPIQADETEEKFRKFTYIMDSMTDEERREAKLNSTRIRRIAKGSGTSPEEVKELVKYYETMKKALKGLKKGRFKGPLARMLRSAKM